MTITHTEVPAHVQLIQPHGDEAGGEAPHHRFVLPEGNTPHFGKLADMVMLAMPGGEERTAGEYEVLLAAAKLRMTRVVPTGSDVSIVEAELA